MWHVFMKSGGQLVEANSGHTYYIFKTQMLNLYSCSGSYQTSHTAYVQHIGCVKWPKLFQISWLSLFLEYTKAISSAVNHLTSSHSFFLLMIKGKISVQRKKKLWLNPKPVLWIELSGTKMPKSLFVWIFGEQNNRI